MQELSEAKISILHKIIRLKTISAISTKKAANPLKLKNISFTFKLSLPRISQGNVQTCGTAFRTYITGPLPGSVQRKKYSLGDVCGRVKLTKLISIIELKIYYELISDVFL